MCSSDLADADGTYSLWAGINVRVKPFPGSAESEPRYIEDERSSDQSPSHAFVFRTREEGREAVAADKAELAARTKAKNATFKDFKSRIHATQVGITNLYHDIRMQLYRLLGALLAAAGLALLFGVLMAAPTLFAVQYQFNLFGFAQTGRHYWEELLAGMRARNPQQPLLGIFIWLALIFVAVFYTMAALITDGIGKLVN